MTTEVLRNMLYAGSATLDGLGYVVMDEVHYLADRFRGAVWEEVIIHLPERRPGRLAVGDGQQRRGVRRLAGRRCAATPRSSSPSTGRCRCGSTCMVGPRLYDLFAADSTPASPASADTRGAPPAAPGTAGRTPRRSLTGTGQPRAAAAWRAEERAPRPPDRGGRGRAGQRHGRPRRRPPAAHARPRPRSSTSLDRARPAAGDHLHLQPGRLRRRRRPVPRRGTAAHHRPTSGDEIRAIVEERCADIRRRGPRRARLLGLASRASARGIAAHHAGHAADLQGDRRGAVLPRAGQGRLRHRDPRARHQHAGPHRGAGEARQVERRDPRRHHARGSTPSSPAAPAAAASTSRATRVVLWQPGARPAGRRRPRLDPHLPAALAASGRPTTWPSTSSARSAATRAREMLETSFAQFQADRAVVGLARQVRRHEEALAGYAEAMTCHLGDFTRVRRPAPPPHRPRKDLARSHAGDHRADALAALVPPAPRRRHRGPRRTPRRLGRRHRPGPTLRHRERPAPHRADRRPPGPPAHRPPTSPAAVEPLTRVTVPKTFNPRNPTSRRDLASTLAQRPRRPSPTALHPPPDRRSPATDDDTRSTELRAALRPHPCHGCADREDHARWAERWWRLRRETDTLIRRIEGRTNTIARVFDRVCDLLAEHGYLAGDTVTDRRPAPPTHLHRVRPPRRRVPPRRHLEPTSTAPPSPPASAPSSTSPAATTPASPPRPTRPPRRPRSPTRSGSGRRSTTASTTTSWRPPAKPDLGLAWADAPVGERPPAGGRAQGRRPRRRRLRPLVQAGRSTCSARSTRRRGTPPAAPRSAQAAARRRRRRPPRRRRLLVRHLTGPLPNTPGAPSEPPPGRLPEHPGTPRPTRYADASWKRSIDRFCRYSPRTAARASPTSARPQDCRRPPSTNESAASNNEE